MCPNRTQRQYLRPEQFLQLANGVVARVFLPQPRAERLWHGSNANGLRVCVAMLILGKSVIRHTQVVRHGFERPKLTNCSSASRSLPNLSRTCPRAHLAQTARVEGATSF